MKILFKTSLIIAILLLNSISSEAVIRYVRTNGPTSAANASSATTWATACNDLQAVINISTDNDEIWVAAGTYKPNRDAENLNTITINNRYNAFVISNNVKIYGGFPATGSPTMATRNYATNQTILSGDFSGNDLISGVGENMTIANNTENAFHVVLIITPTGNNGIYPRLDGFTIKGGNTNGFPLVQNDRIVINGQILTDIYGDGGGLFQYISNASIVNCIFTGNYAQSGGAMNIKYGFPKVVNCLFHKNIAPWSGGGAININSSSTEIINCTISNNFAEAGGGVMANSANPTIKNSIIFGNYDYGGYNDILYYYENEVNIPIITYSLVGGITTGTGNINPTNLTPASVFNTPNSNYNLIFTSPTKNAGSNAAYNSTLYGTFDLAHNTRISSTSIDMGAYEVQQTAVTGITVAPTTLTLEVEGISELTATIAPANATNQNITWSSSNSNIASVVTGQFPNIGIVGGGSTGTAIITATTADGGFTAQCTVTVVNPVTSITVAPPTLTLNPEAYQNITATIAPANATNQNITWTSSDNNVATVSDLPGQIPNLIGVVSGVSPGTAIITATTEDGGFTAQCTVTVVSPVTGVTVAPTTLTLEVGGSSDLTATIAPANATNQNITWSSSNSNIASVVTGQFPNIGIVGGVSPGTAIITATTADGGFTAQCTVTVVPATVPVTGVTITPTTLTLEVGDLGTATVSIIPSNATNDLVNWSSSNPAIATATWGTNAAQGFIEGIAPGTAIITATTEDGGFTAQCTVTVVPIAVTGLTITPNTMNIQIGNSANINPTITPANAANQNITWTSSNNNVATVANSPAGNFAIVTGESVGTAIIIATTQDGGFTARCTVTVAPILVNGVSLNNTTLNLIEGNQSTLTASVTPANATNTNVTWSSSNSNIATVNNGVVSAIAPGNAIISVTTVDGGFTATCSVTVTAQNISVTSVNLNNSSLEMYVGSDALLVATVLPSNATNKNVTWSSSNTNIASVSNGLVVSLSPGTTVITVTTVDGGFTGRCTVTVQTPIIQLTGLRISQTSLTMVAGDETQLTTTPIPANASNASVVWSSLNGNIATVNQSGIVTAINQGTTRIFATSAVNSSIIAFCDVTVTPNTIAVTGVEINDIPDENCRVGLNYQFIKTVLPANASNRNVNWSSNNPSVAVINSNGLATFLAPGIATITVTTQDGGFTASRALTITNNNIPVTGIEIYNGVQNLESTLGSPIPIEYVISPENATNKLANWTSSNPAVVSIVNIPMGDGTIGGAATANSIGVAILTATTQDGGFTAQCTVTVIDNTPIVSVTDMFLDREIIYLTVGAEDNIICTLIPEDATNKKVHWGSTNSSIVQVDSTGKIKGLIVGSAAVSAIADDGGYIRSCGVHVITTTVPVEGISFEDGTSITLNEGDIKKLNLLFYPPDASNRRVTWLSNNTDVITVDESGIITALNAGTATIVVTTQDGAYTATCQITVIRTNIPIEEIAISPFNIQLLLPDGYKQLDVVFTPKNASNKNLTWSSNAPNIAKVDNYGLVTAVSEGYAQITATSEDGGKSADCFVRVYNNVILIEEFKLHINSLELNQGETNQIRPIFIPENASNKNINWNSSNQNIARVDASGFVSAINPGTAIITAVTEDGNKTATCQVIVKKKVNVEEANNFGINVWSDDKYINIDLSKSRIPLDKVKIYDLTGVCMYENSSPSEIISVELQTGVYLVKVGEFSRKVVLIK